MHSVHSVVKNSSNHRVHGIHGMKSLGLEGFSCCVRFFSRAREDFTGSPENTPAQRVDGLAVEDNFGRQPRNGSVPTGDLIVQVLSFGVFNY